MKSFMKETVSKAMERHNERAKNGRYQVNSKDARQALADTIHNSTKASMEYANSLVYEVLKKLLIDDQHQK